MPAHGYPRYCQLWKKWLAWLENRWAKDGTGEVERRAKETVYFMYTEASLDPDEKKRKKLTNWARKSESEHHIRAMISLAKTEAGIPVTPDQLDTHAWMLNCLNGTLELKTGQLRPWRREDLITKIVLSEYLPEAGCPTWEKFLARITKGNKNLMTFLQRVAGYAATGDTSEQVLFLLWGTGANGKSTFLECLRALFGDYAKTSETTTFLAKPFDSVRNDIARLAGARFVSANEVELGRRLAEGLVKQLTGRDTISARFLFAEHFEFRPQFKLLMAVNNKPVIQGTDDAIWRRIRLIPFMETIPLKEQDKRLPEKLEKELPGILAWVVRGCQQWQREGLMEPDEVLKATESYREEMDVLRRFIEECCTEGPLMAVSAGELYDSYRQWCKKNDEEAVSKKEFGRRLGERGYEPKRTTRGSDRGKRLWRGIGLLSTCDSEM